MKLCADCQKPIVFSWNNSNVCPSCRGKRTAAINRAKREKHGPSYFDRRSDARREAL